MNGRLPDEAQASCIFAASHRGSSTRRHSSLGLNLRKDCSMAVRIRLKRIGAKNRPVYRIVVAHDKGKRDGRFIEEVGTYSPLQTANNFTLNAERVQYWLGVGAQPSETVRALLKRAQKNAAKA
jgi:small subunit ribosomal protein S16